MYVNMPYSYMECLGTLNESSTPSTVYLRTYCFPITMCSSTAARPGPPGLGSSICSGNCSGPRRPGYTTSIGLVKHTTSIGIPGGGVGHMDDTVQPWVFKVMELNLLDRAVAALGTEQCSMAPPRLCARGARVLLGDQRKT